VSNLTNMQRKIVFALGILFLFVAMYPYKQFLHAEAVKRDLGEATMGEVDTGSFMLKLALLGGARGIAANVLWMRAQDLQKAQDWDKMEATVNLITKLQPHFLQIWTFQGWNLAYNVSVEWDAPEDKYEWIKKGIQFLQDGVKKNRKSPDLIWNTAWTYYHKLGFADESIILRRLFRDDSDEEFKTYVDPRTHTQVVGNDNFLLGYGWFSRSVDFVDEGESRLAAGSSAALDFVDPSPQHKGKANDITFRSMPAHAQTRYAAGLEKMSMQDIPATFGEVAKNAWAEALTDWVKFGKHTYETHNEVLVDGKWIRYPVQIDDDTDEKKRDAMPDNQRYWTGRWSDQTNYRYWKDRCQTEMTDQGVQARQLFYEGTIAYKTADFGEAVKKFRSGLDVWDELLKSHRDYRNDDINKKDTGLIVRRYLRALRQLGEPEPKDVPFHELLASAEKDLTLDPFDATEMLGVTAEPNRPNSPPPAPAPRDMRSPSSSGISQ
jgi:hypothetical protein